MSIDCGNVILSGEEGDTPTTTQSSALYLRSRGSPAVRPFSIVETLGRPIDSVLRLRGVKEDLRAEQSVSVENFTGREI